MRKTIRKVLDAFKSSTMATEPSCSTMDGVFYSYQTAIAFRRGDGTTVLCTERYSDTTGLQQSAIRCNCEPLIEVDLDAFTTALATFKGSSVATVAKPAREPYERSGCSRYGAQMGRRSDDKLEGKVHLKRVPIVDGYDPGGAYWGDGYSPLYCAYDDNGAEVYFRAANRVTAKSHESLKGCTFYR